MELDRESYKEKARKMIVSLTKSHVDKTLRITVNNSDVQFIDKVHEFISQFKILVTTVKKKDDTLFEYQIIA